MLQDIVNEIGRRLGYEVEPGYYQGRAQEIGFDGIWRGPEGSCIVVEVKTTDAFRVSIGTIASYRDRLSGAGRVPSSAALLLVVGREDTGELEAQVRGSRHAWDTRIISVDALVRLVALRESTETEASAERIRGLLTPVEYTRLDNLADLLFITARDLEATITNEEVAEDSASASESAHPGSQQTPTAVLQERREAALVALGASDGHRRIKRTRATFWDSTHAFRAVCAVSKRYDRKHQVYWYSYWPTWHAFLQEGETGHLLLGFVDRPAVYAIPVAVVQAWTNALNVTKKPGLEYWHLSLTEPTQGDLHLLLPKTGQQVSLKPYALGVRP